MNDIKKGVATDNLDINTSPKEDFYQYACGGWKAAHPLTPEYSNFGIFDSVRETAREQLNDLITNLPNHPDAKIQDTLAQKASDLYSLAMDEGRRNAEGATPILPLLEEIENADTSDMARLLAWQHFGIGGSFFNSGVGSDAMNSDINILHIGEVGLGLGDRDLYIEDNEYSLKIREAYKTYIMRMMELAGYDAEAQQRIMDTVMRIETEMARHKMTREDRRDPLKRYNVFTMDEIPERFPLFDWQTYFSGLGVEKADKVNFANPDFITFVTEFISSLTDREIKDYMLFETVSDASGLLSDDFEEASFELYGKVMSGKEEDEPRWKKAVGLVNAMLGEAIGKLFVEKHFPEENKFYMLRLTENLRDALRSHIMGLSWMSDTTKKKAVEKLEAMKVKIGYPDKWKDYSEIHVDPALSYHNNVLAASKWFVKDNYSKLGKPVDKEEWHITPQTVNAYYSPVSNEVCFPAAILQPPFFDPEADDSMNYGAIGVVIGHEMTHGFDDSGRKFDKNGNLAEWWTEEDAVRFTALADKLVEQFDAIEVAPDTKANGRFTLGENIADQGGLRIALTAYRKSTEESKPEDIDGFSPLQRFYISYATVWAGNIREEEIKIRTKTDPHSLGKLRTNATLKNVDEFFDAFSVSEGDAMWRKPEDRVVIW